MCNITVQNNYTNSGILSKLRKPLGTEGTILAFHFRKLPFLEREIFSLSQIGTEEIEVPWKNNARPAEVNRGRAVSVSLNSAKFRGDFSPGNCAINILEETLSNFVTFRSPEYRRFTSHELLKITSTLIATATI